MILIHPPVAKPSEPPAGIARLSGALSSRNIPHAVVDANLEGLEYLLRSCDPLLHSDRWSRRALRNAEKNISNIRSADTYQNLDRYKRAVFDLERALEASGQSVGVTAGLANYQDAALSPLRSADLIAAAERPQKNLFYPYFRQRLAGIVAERNATVAGLSLNFLSQALCTFAMIGFLRSEFPDLKIILGGSLLTSWMRNPQWKNPFAGLIDHLVEGPGEERLLSILGVKTADESFMPDYGLLPCDSYLSPGFVLPYSGSSGCFWNRCSFCPEKAEGNPYRQIPPAMIAEELNLLAIKHKPKLIHLLDSSVSIPAMEAIAMKGPGINWYGFARISSQLTDPDFCMGLKNSGCVMLKLGLESGDQWVLDKLHKGIDLVTASKVLKTLKKTGIATYVYLIFGTPPENGGRAQKTLHFVAAHAAEIDFLNLAIFNMPSYGADAETFQLSSFYEGDLSLYTDFTHPDGWGRRKVRSFLDNEFKRHAAIKPILIKEPPVFTSNHAPFFVTRNI